MTEQLSLQTGNRRRLLIVMALGLFVCFVAISSKSYWLDEVGVAYKASLPTLREWWHSLKYGDANLQLPFYHIFARVWVKVTGINEFTLRAGNVPWFLLGLIVFLRALKSDKWLAWCISLALLTNPFVWYYLNEARPYAMQIGTSLVVFGALYRLGGVEELVTERRWVLTLCLGSILLAGSGMLAMLWLGAYIGGAVFSDPRERLLRLARNHWRIWSVTLVIVSTIGIFYLWTVMRGVRATNVGTTDARNLLFVLYELFGFSGLGPGRLVIRGEGFSAFRPWFAWLAVYGMLLALVFVPGLRYLKELVRPRTVLVWGIAFGLICAFITAVGVAVRFRVLGRHFAPVIPLFLLVLGTGAAALLKRPSLLARTIPIGFLTLSMVSALSLRFNSRHAKDEYRGAALLGVEALQKGEVVWWNADPDGASIYHLALAERDPLGKGARFLMNPLKDFEQKLPKPDLVLASKADVYDQKGAVEDYLTRNSFRPVTNFPAFTAWHAPIK